MLWEDALMGYWLERRRNLSPATVTSYEYTFRRFRASLGDAPVHIEAVTSDQVRTWLSALRDKGLAPKSIANDWVALSALWTWAERELKIPHAIRGRVAQPTWRRPPIAAYTRTEVGAMLNAAERNAAWTSRNGKVVQERRSTAGRDRAVLLVLLDTGLRASELCDLTIADYDQKQGRLHIRHGKGNKGRYVFLGDVARKAVWRYLADRPGHEPGQPLFATGRGNHLERNALRHLVQGCAERAGVEGATVHRWRHTFAINYLRNGGSVLELQRLMGHERVDTLRIYVDLAASDLQEAQRRASPADNWKL
jgi:integrase/recombinase XerD